MDGSSQDCKNKCPKTFKAIQKIMRGKAKGLAKSRRSGYYDQDDYEQELWLHYLPRSRKSNGKHTAPLAIAHNAAKQGAASICRRLDAEKRRPVEKVKSLDAIVSCSDGGSRSFSEMISQSALGARLGRRSRSKISFWEMAQDLRVFLASLPDEDRELVLRRLDESIIAIARSLDARRETIAAWLGQIRHRFEAAWLYEYLNDDPSSR